MLPILDDGGQVCGTSDNTEVGARLAMAEVDVLRRDENELVQRIRRIFKTFPMSKRHPTLIRRSDRRHFRLPQR